jgi:hypothetical protein
MPTSVDARRITRANPPALPASGAGPTPDVSAPRAASEIADTSRQRSSPSSPSPPDGAMTKQEVMPRWPELSEHKDQIRNLESLFTEMLSRVSALESKVTQMASQVPFLRRAGYSKSIRCAATEERLSQLELDVAKALHRDGDPPNAALRGGARRTVVALTQDPKDSGSDAESSDQSEDAHKKRGPRNGPSKITVNRQRGVKRPLGLVPEQPNTPRIKTPRQVGLTQNRWIVSPPSNLPDPGRCEYSGTHLCGASRDCPIPIGLLDHRLVSSLSPE